MRRILPALLFLLSFTATSALAEPVTVKMKIPDTTEAPDTLRNLQITVNPMSETTVEVTVEIEKDGHRLSAISTFTPNLLKEGQNLPPVNSTQILHETALRRKYLVVAPEGPTYQVTLNEHGLVMAYFRFEGDREGSAGLQIQTAFWRCPKTTVILTGQSERFDPGT